MERQALATQMQVVIYRRTGGEDEVDMPTAESVQEMLDEALQAEAASESMDPLDRELLELLGVG